MRLKDRIYAYYEEGEYITEGTIEDIQLLTGKPYNTLKWLTSTNCMRRKLTTVLVDVTDLDTFLSATSLNEEVLAKLRAHNILTGEDLIRLPEAKIPQILPTQRERKMLRLYRDYFLKVAEEDAIAAEILNQKGVM